MKNMIRRLQSRSRHARDRMADISLFAPISASPGDVLTAPPPESLLAPSALPYLAEVVIVLPVYNEQACIERTLNAIEAYLENHPNYIFLFVNDGSRDRTAAILTEHIRTVDHHQIQLLSYQPQGGKGHAIRTGMRCSQSELPGNFFCFLDSDLAYSLDHLDLLIEQLYEDEVVIGCRNQVAASLQRVSPLRKVAGKIYNWFSRAILGLSYRDMQAGLKGFRREAAQVLFAKQRLTGFSFDVELIYLAHKWGFSIGEIPATVSKSHQAKVSKVNLLQDSLKMLLDLLKIRWNDLLGRYC
ncbi:glycosyltransferase [Alkalinema pantanalense CENA528]|uniref:glycosyltransferase n=1 Tax=Alkalinema pantanalense TaxID=1620705 RepID=UPI003D6DB099